MTNSSRIWLALAAAIVATGCRGGDTRTVPTTLSDGSPTRPPPSELEGLDEPVVATRARVVSAADGPAASATARCIASVGGDAHRAMSAVERVDVHGGSVTFRAQGGRTVHGCDHGRADPKSWCGHAFAALRGGRARDPRLSIGCRDDGPIGHAWVDPARAAAYVVVAHEAYREVYRVVGDVPVRVASENVDLSLSRARFDVTEHDRDGRLIRAYEVEAAVSG